MLPTSGTTRPEAARALRSLKLVMMLAVVVPQGGAA